MPRGGWVAPDSKKQRLIYLEANKATPAKSNTPLNLWNVCHGVLLLSLFSYIQVCCIAFVFKIVYYKEVYDTGGTFLSKKP